MPSVIYPLEIHATGRPAHDAPNIDDLEFDNIFPLPPLRSLKQLGRDRRTHTVAVYCAIAPYITRFAQTLEITACKIGATGCGDVSARLRDLTRKQYGRILRVPQSPVAAHALLDPASAWSLKPISSTAFRAMVSPPGIGLTAGYLEVEVPTSVSVTDVDRMLAKLLKPHRFDAWLSTDRARCQLVSAGINPSSRLFTSYELMTIQPRLSIATEIYAFDIDRNLPSLMEVVSKLLAALSSK